MLQVEKYTLGPLGNNLYLLEDPEKEKVVLIDAPLESWKQIHPILKKKGKPVAAVFLTHGHWDHMAEAALFQKAGAKIYAHTGDHTWVENPEEMGFYLPANFQLNPCKPDVILQGDEIIEVMGEAFHILPTPGHSPGCICVYLKSLARLFSGDTLFSSGVGRTDLPGGNWEQLQSSIKEKLACLPEDTIIHPGHGPDTQLGVEKRTNPFIR